MNRKVFLMAITSVCMAAQGAWAESVTFNVRSWDATNKQVKTTATTKDCTVLTGNPGEWMMLGSSSDQNDHYYVVKGMVSYQTLNVFGKAHLILADGATLTLTGGLKVDQGNNFGEIYIYSQSDGDSEGRLVVTNSYKGAAGIGSSEGRNSGPINIYGGKLDITGGQYAAGIGAGKCTEDVATKINGGVFIYGGTVVTHGGDSGAGIGGGAYNNSGPESETGNVCLYGGTVTATGGELASGVGGGGGWHSFWPNKDYNGGVGYTVDVYGGTLTAQGGHRGSGIGAGSFSHPKSDFIGGTLNVHGGTVNATGGDCGAGIGGGYNASGGTVNVSGGTVNAKGGYNGAGIGGGEDGNGGTVTISGGTVRAEGTSYGAGIGGGECFYQGNGANVTITGGTVTAIAGNDCKGSEAKGGSAIGCGRGMSEKDRSDRAGTLSLPANYRVTAGDSESNPERVFTTGERIAACRWRNYAKIEACDHTKQNNDNDAEVTTYTIPDDTHHTWHCRYCATTGTALHDYPGYSNCVCGKAYNADDDTWTVTIHTTTNGTTIANGQANQVVKGHGYVLPAPQAIEGLIFMGYLQTSTAPATGIEMADAEYQNLMDAGEVITPTANTEFYARYRYSYESTWTWAADGSSVQCDISIDTDILKETHTAIGISYLAEDKSAYVAATADADGQRVFDATATYTRTSGVVYQFTDRIVIPLYYVRSISLSDNASNDELLEANDGQPANVTLSGRTLYKDGYWNTLCLPFDVSTFAGTPLEGATVKTLGSSSFADGTLTLNFTEASSIEAGKPYLVKWTTTGSDVTSPVFNDVTINHKYDMVESESVNFMGNTSPFTLEADDKTVLYLGADNTLYYPNAYVPIGSCRAVFQLKGLTAGDLASGANARRFVLNFGDDGEVTGIVNAETNSSLFTLNSSLKEGWYDLLGRRLSGKPTAKGLYINNGKKIVIK